MKEYIYILKESKNIFYIGSTTDIKRRLEQHNTGHTWTTHRMDKPELVFMQEYNLLSEARIIERKIKKLKRKDYIVKIIRDGEIKIKI